MDPAEAGQIGPPYAGHLDDRTGVGSIYHQAGPDVDAYVVDIGRTEEDQVPGEQL